MVYTCQIFLKTKITAEKVLHNNILELMGIYFVSTSIQCQIHQIHHMYCALILIKDKCGLKNYPGFKLFYFLLFYLFYLL